MGVAIHVSGRSHPGTRVWAWHYRDPDATVTVFGNPTVFFCIADLMSFMWY